MGFWPDPSDPQFQGFVPATMADQTFFTSDRMIGKGWKMMESSGSSSPNSGKPRTTAGFWANLTLCESVWNFRNVRRWTWQTSGVWTVPKRSDAGGNGRLWELDAVIVFTCSDITQLTMIFHRLPQISPGGTGSRSWWTCWRCPRSQGLGKNGGPAGWRWNGWNYGSI